MGRVLASSFFLTGIFKKVPDLKLLGILFLLGQSVYGQHPGFRQFRVEDGLESPTVYSCTQDDKGYLWFGTESGVSRFNGRKFESFSIDEGLADNEVFGIYQDRYKRIWFLS
jgi:ligand-binding sensor domain-containing protein